MTTAEAIAKMMDVWNRVQAIVIAKYPHATLEQVYELTSASMNKMLNISASA